jgi:hypothetical protein
MFLPSKHLLPGSTRSQDRYCFSGSKSPERAGLLQTEVERGVVGECSTLTRRQHSANLKTPSDGVAVLRNAPIPRGGSPLSTVC